jgi:glycosyltransferase involved in cell wall biosynthesis
MKDQLQIYPPFQLSRFSQSFENDPRIFYLPYQRLSLFNFGGSSRNAAMKHVTTEWIAYLDDDDEISPDYLSLHRKESQLHPSVSVILFRMACQTCFEKIIPPVPYPALVLNYVGPHNLSSFS